MAHGGYVRRRVAERGPFSRRTRGGGGGGVGVVNNKKKPKSVSLKNQIRSTERVLQRKNLPQVVRTAQEKRLEVLKREQETQNRVALERKFSIRYRKIKFFERRKIERGIRRLEKLQRSDKVVGKDITGELARLKEDLEYVRFFPKTEKYVSLFMGSDDPNILEIRNKLRKQIKLNLISAAASGKDLEETGSDDDGLLDGSGDDFFLSGSSSDEADADDEWTDRSTREQASSTSGKAASGMSSDEKNQRQISARALMPPPRSAAAGRPTNNVANISRQASTSGRGRGRGRPPRNNFTSSSHTSWSRDQPSANIGSRTHTDPSSNISSNSDAHKPRRKRRPKKKKLGQESRVSETASA